MCRSDGRAYFSFLGSLLTRGKLQHTSKMLDHRCKPPLPYRPPHNKWFLCFVGYPRDVYERIKAAASKQRLDDGTAAVAAPFVSWLLRKHTLTACDIDYSIILAGRTVAIPVASSVRR